MTKQELQQELFDEINAKLLYSLGLLEDLINEEQRYIDLCMKDTIENYMKLIKKLSVKELTSCKFFTYVLINDSEKFNYLDSCLYVGELEFDIKSRCLFHKR